MDFLERRLKAVFIFAILFTSFSTGLIIGRMGAPRKIIYRAAPVQPTNQTWFARAVYSVDPMQEELNRAEADGWDLWEIQHGIAEPLTSVQAVSPASLTALQESVKELLTNVTCGRK